MSNYNISTDGFDPDPVAPQAQAQRRRKVPDQASRRPSRPKKISDKPGAVLQFLKDKRTHMFVGILLLLVAMYSSRRARLIRARCSIIRSTNWPDRKVL